MHLRKAIIGMCVDSRDTECLNECMYVQCCGDGLLYATIRSVKAKSGVWGCWRSVGEVCVLHLHHKARLDMLADIPAC